MSKARAAWQAVKGQLSNSFGADFVARAFKQDLGPAFDEVDAKCVKFTADAAAFLKERVKDKAKSDAMADELDKIKGEMRKKDADAEKKAKAAGNKNPKTLSDDTKVVLQFKKIRIADIEQQKKVEKEIGALEALAEAIKKADEQIANTLDNYGVVVAVQAKALGKNAPWEQLVSMLRNAYALAHNKTLEMMAAKDQLDFCEDLKKLTQCRLAH